MTPDIQTDAHRKPYDTMASFQQMSIDKRHHGENRFLNPFQKRDRNFKDLVRWKLLEPNRFKEDLKHQKEIPVHVDWKAVREHEGLSLTFLKHACVIIKDQGRYFMVDPVFGKPMFLIKDYSPLGFDPDAIPNPDVILLTHGHYDHFNIPTLSRYSETAHFITPLGYEDLLQDMEVSFHTAMDWFQTTTLHHSRITFLPCNHWTMRNPISGPNRRLWGSYLIETRTGPTVFIAGDTAWFDEYAVLGQKYSIDLAVFNLGAYEPRWFMKGSHMNPEETIRACKALNARRFMIVHWGAFQLGDEPVYLPPVELKKELEKQGLLEKWVDLKPGDTLFF